LVALGIVDDDAVALSNRRRQIVHGAGDVDRQAAKSLGCSCVEEAGRAKQ
jgi:molybdopterin/thiamine biosynthesis adenylyltransferase